MRKLLKTISLIVAPPVIIHRDGLVGVGHHGDEHVEKHDDVTHGVETEHEQGPEPGEFLYSCSNNCNNCPREMLYIFLSQHLECRNCKKSLQKYKQTRSANRANFASFFLPFSSKSERLTRPKTAQNKDWVVSKRLQNLLHMRQDACPPLHFSWLNSQSFFSKANLTMRYVITLKNSNIFYKNIRIFAHQPKYSSS